MKRLMMMLLAMCSMAAAQTCVPGGGVTCTSHIGLWVLPYNYANWNTPVNDNAQLIDTWSATVLPLAGGTMTGNLILNGDPTIALQAATKNYVDTHIAAGSFTLGSTSITLGTTTTSVNGLTLDGVSPTTFGYVDPTSSIQTQLDGKAAKGANSDITSLLGLTTPLSPTEGGTGSGAIASALMLGTTSGGVLQAETIGANTVVGNGTGVTAVPTALAMPSCSTSSSALQWTSATGFSCNTGISASTITVGTTAISGGTSGNIEYNNGGVLGEKSTTGSGSVVLATSPTLTTPNIGAATAVSITQSGTAVNTFFGPISSSGGITDSTSLIAGTGANGFNITPTALTEVSSGTTIAKITNGTLMIGNTGATSDNVSIVSTEITLQHNGVVNGLLDTTGNLDATNVVLGSDSGFHSAPRSYPGWHISSTLAVLNQPYGPVPYSTQGGVIEAITANVEGSPTCTTYPTVAIYDCGTSVTGCSPGTLLANLVTTGAGQFAATGLGVVIAAGHYFAAELTANSCSVQPTIDVSATVRQR